MEFLVNEFELFKAIRQMPLVPQIIKRVRKKANKQKYLLTMCMSLGTAMGMGNIKGVVCYWHRWWRRWFLDMGISISGHDKGLHRESSFRKIRRWRPESSDIIHHKRTWKTKTFCSFRKEQLYFMKIQDKYSPRWHGKWTEDR